MDGVDVYSTAKSEYTEQFCIFIVPALLGYFLDMMKLAKEEEKNPLYVYSKFQDLLKDIPEWNQDKVLRETEKISLSSKCDYLEELLTAVFIAHTKVLSAIRLTNREKKKIQITVPKLEHFLHRTLSESARILWSSAYLFIEKGSSEERQKNLRQVEQLLHQAVLQSIRGMLPVKSILKEYLNTDSDKSTDQAEEEEEEEEKEDAVEAVQETKKEESVEGGGAPPALETPLVQLDLSGVEQQAAESSEPVLPPVPANTPEQGQSPVATSAPAPAPPIIIVDTEPSVKFAEHDTFFDSENPEANEIRAPIVNSEEDDEHIKILDSVPESVDDFEELDSGLGGGDFETLA
jgi:hypothetical protein